jgi:hypothetical protein
MSNFKLVFLPISQRLVGGASDGPYYVFEHGKIVRKDPEGPVDFLQALQVLGDVVQLQTVGVAEAAARPLAELAERQLTETLGLQQNMTVVVLQQR